MMRDVCRKISIYVIAAGILCLTLAFFILPHRDFSESENRPLASWPTFGFEALINGSYADSMKDYMTDHFPGRDIFLGLKSRALRISGRKLIDGVYLTSDHGLINDYVSPVNIPKDIRQFNKLSENLESAHMSLMVVPTAVSIYCDELPANAPYTDRMKYYLTHRDTVPDGYAVEYATIDAIYSAMNDTVDCIDVSARLSAHSSDTVTGIGSDVPVGIYYRTDHHWTMYGAYLGYTAYMDAIGKPSVGIDDFVQNAVTDGFCGSIYSKLNDTHIKPDTMISCTDPGWELTVTYEDTGVVTDTPYDETYLDQRDKYSYFLSNIHPFITIDNEAVADGAIAVVKDSYANSLIPFLCSSFHTVYVFDTRYYKGGVSGFVNDHPEIGEVLVLYNTGTLDNDTGIGGIY